MSSHLRHPHQEQGQPAQHDVGSDAVFPAVVAPSQVEDLLREPPAALDRPGLLVAEGDVLR